MITNQHPQQRRNFTIVFDGYSDTTGVFDSLIDNSINGGLHIIWPSTLSIPPPDQIDLQITLDNLPVNNIQTYMITGQGFVIDVKFNTGMQVLKNGTFQVNNGETLTIEAANINGTIFVEGKIFTQ